MLGLGLGLQRNAILAALAGGGGGGGGTYDFTAAVVDTIPVGFTAQNGLTFDNPGSYTELIPYVYPGNGRGCQLMGDADDYDGGDADLRLTFTWPVSADTVTDAYGPAIFDPTDPVDPAYLCTQSDRNFNRIKPGKYDEAGSAGNLTITGFSNTHSLTGSELTADGTTQHTMGIRFQGDDMTVFFDDVVQGGPVTLDANEKSIKEGCTRIGLFFPSQNHGRNMRFITLEIAAQGTIYPTV